MAPSSQPILDHSDVHIWRANLQQPAAIKQSLWRLLSEDERSRAEKFHVVRDHDRFVVARGLLRTLLGSYLDVDPHHIRFCYSPYGKPMLVGEHGKAALRFNLAHAHELALYAVASGREVGIDIEYIRPEVATMAIAAQFFSPSEVAMLHATPPAMRSVAFFNCWTRKEAYIKAHGAGLSLPLDRFAVSLMPGAPAELLHVADDAREQARWSLLALDPGTGYVAALAAEGQDWIATCWQHSF